VEWLQGVLATCNPDHEFFSKGYVKPRVVKVSHPELYVENADDFFTDLPVPKHKGKSHKMGTTVKKMADYKPISQAEAREKVLSIVRQRDVLNARIEDVRNQYEQHQTPAQRHAAARRERDAPCSSGTGPRPGQEHASNSDQPIGSRS
jgi:hypothetical protein